MGIECSVCCAVARQLSGDLQADSAISECECGGRYD